MANTWQTSAESDLHDQAAALNARFAGDDGEGALAFALKEGFTGRIAVVSSFGAESSVLLHLVSTIDPFTPVIFLDTEKLFEETRAYRETLASHLGLADVRSIRPTAAAVAADDPAGDLHQTNPNLCCHIRKTIPMVRALQPFRAWVTGRKRHQTGEREALDLFEVADGRIKVNPLKDWNAKRLRERIAALDLPMHPMVPRGYPSIGCAPCTTAVRAGEDPRAGRWRGEEKKECGIHFTREGKVVRTERRSG